MINDVHLLDEEDVHHKLFFLDPLFFKKISAKYKILETIQIIIILPVFIGISVILIDLKRK